MKNGLLVKSDRKEYYKNNLLHREDGPAVEYNNGDKAWFINGILHRKDGPAMEYVNIKSWYLNGLIHREDGPAIERPDGSKFYYLFNQEIEVSSLEEFKRYVELLTFE